MKRIEEEEKMNVYLFVIKSLASTPPQPPPPPLKAVVCRHVNPTPYADPPVHSVKYSFIFGVSLHSYYSRSHISIYPHPRTYTLAYTYPNM